jgi:hypothetical protein
MKITLKFLRTIVFIALMAISFQALSQTNPPPPPGGSSGDQNTEGNRNGGGAPIGGGLFILLGLGGAYGGYKLYQKKKKSLLD